MRFKSRHDLRVRGLWVRGFILALIFSGLGAAAAVGATQPIPIHWWSGDGSTWDRAGNAPGTILSGVTYDEGRFGKAFRFDGSGGGVSVGPGVGNLGTNDFAVTLWVNVQSGTEILSKRQLCGPSVLWDIRYVEGRLWTSIMAGGPSVVLKATMSSGEWHHVAFCREGQVLKSYIDGVLAAQGVDPAVTHAGVDNTAPLLLGEGPCGSPLKGLIDEVRIYDRALTAGEVTDQANAEVVSLVDRLRRGMRRLVVDFGVGKEQFSWAIEPESGETFAPSVLETVELEATTDLRSWSTVPGGLRWVEGKLQATDAAVRGNSAKFYRLISRNPRVPAGTGGAVAITKVSTNILNAARRHIESFVDASVGVRTPEDQAWAGVEFGPEAREVFDPGYHGGLQPAFVELKLVSSRGEPRGYVLVSTTATSPAVVEFSQEGLTKTERAQKENGGRLPHRFVRFNGAFMALEDAAGDYLGSLGTWPSLQQVPPVRNEAAVFSGGFDTETGESAPLAARNATRLPTSGYAALRAGFAYNPPRLTLARLRSAVEESRSQTLGGSRLRLGLPVGATRDYATSTVFASVRVDTDGEEDLPSVKVLPRALGFRVLGVRPGTDLIRARSMNGDVYTYSVTVSAAGERALATTGNCRSVVVHRYTAGEGWQDDQPQYHQTSGDTWCPAVGCGPAALTMLFAWWDIHGVPSAFYRLRSGFGEAVAFSFELASVRDQDAGLVVSAGEEFTGPGGVEFYKLSVEEGVMHDFHKLANTFCVDGQGATVPWDMTGAATEYVARVAANLNPPRDQFGEKFIGASLQFSYTDGYWAGMTDWQGGGVMVAEGIKQGRPGIVGLGDTLFDLHYALAFGYRRVDTFEGCGTDRELVDRRRWFKCNMGWGPNHDPEWHDAESVWFGLTARLWQKVLPQGSP